MAKKKTQPDVPNDNMLLQIDHKNHIYSNIVSDEKNIDDFDMGNVEDLMDKYDSTEKT